MMKDLTFNCDHTKDQSDVFRLAYLRRVTVGTAQCTERSATVLLASATFLCGVFALSVLSHQVPRLVWLQEWNHNKTHHWSPFNEKDHQQSSWIQLWTTLLRFLQLGILPFLSILLSTSALAPPTGAPVTERFSVMHLFEGCFEK